MDGVEADMVDREVEDPEAAVDLVEEVDVDVGQEVEEVEVEVVEIKWMDVLIVENQATLGGSVQINLVMN